MSARSPRLAAVLAAAIALPAVRAQEPIPAPATGARELPEPAVLLERFAGLDFRRKAVIVRTLQRQLATLDDPALRRIAAWRTDTAGLPDARSEPLVFDPARWASEEHAAGRAPSRTPIARDDPRWQRLAQRYARPPWLPELRREVDYDWADGRLVRLQPLDYDALFANAAYGFAPGTDEALAGILLRLDRAGGERQRKLGTWFAHTYCDLEAHCYPGITLYDAWYSGEQVDVPDVDAIPFAWEILGQRSLRSPLSGPPRDRLYEAIRDAALEYRQHRTLLEAAAAAYVRAAPTMDPTYALLVPRFHYLFATRGDDVEAVVDVVRREGRDGVIDEVDAAVRRPDGEAWQIREAHKTELATMELRIRRLAADALERLGG
ncbi:MAG: hypothetical protein IPM29_01110 [Planctomycetes bacterium]|nr:hypothetical protein [Planctomycetota bacterium]